MNNFTYLRRITNVEAFKVPPDDEQTRAWPSWFFKAIGFGTLIVKRDGAIFINGARESRNSNLAEVGDWLVKLEDDSFDAFSDTDFHKLFEQAPAVAERKAA